MDSNEILIPKEQIMEQMQPLLEKELKKQPWLKGVKIKTVRWESEGIVLCLGLNSSDKQ